MYADDVVLLAETERDLQILMYSSVVIVHFR